MQVSDEMRRIIERRIEAQIERKAMETENEHELLAEKLNQQLAESDEWHTACDAIRRLNELLDQLAAENDGIYVNGHFQYLWGTPIQRKIPTVKDRDEIVDSIVMQLLLCQDSDAAKEVLAEYGIEL